MVSSQFLQGTQHAPTGAFELEFSSDCKVFHPDLGAAAPYFIQVLTLMPLVQGCLSQPGYFKQPHPHPRPPASQFLPWFSFPLTIYGNDTVDVTNYLAGWLSPLTGPTRAGISVS